MLLSRATSNYESVATVFESRDACVGMNHSFSEEEEKTQDKPVT
jgi:hypothetical protein